MTTTDELQKKIDDIQKRHAAVLKKKAESAGELKAKKEELAALIKDITTAGHNPKTLVEDKAKLEAELTAEIAEFEKKLAEAEAGLSAFEKK